MKATWFAVFAALLAPVANAAADDEPRNVILMIADGAGFTTWEAAAYYRGNRGKQFFNAAGWVTMGVSTHALRDDAEVSVSLDLGRTQLPALVYDPVRAWDTTPVEGEAGGYPYYFEGYKWLRHAPDSACTATALVSGVKSYIGAINVDGNGEPIEETLPWLAHAAGMRTGTLSSVPFNHATPAAAGGAHNVSRSDYCAIAWELLTSPTLDLLGGAGNPDFDNNGVPIVQEKEKIYRDVGEKQIWDVLNGRARIKPGDPICAAAESDEPETEIRRATKTEVEALNRWVLKQTQAEIGAVQTGATPERLLLLPQVGRMGYWSGGPPDPHHSKDISIGGTLQQQRGSRANPKYTAPGDDPLIAGVPALEVLTRAALNALDDGPVGFYLHVEGGAVDWAMHQNQMGRTIEEMIDFEQAVLAVVEWVDARDAWDTTLLIVTADHDHLLAGPASDEIPFQPLLDNGPGELPSYKWLSRSHSNHLVPVFARGAGVTLLHDLVRGQDPFRGAYVDQTDLYRVMRAVIDGTASAKNERAKN